MGFVLKLPICTQAVRLRGWCTPIRHYIALHTPTHLQRAACTGATAHTYTQYDEHIVNTPSTPDTNMLVARRWRVHAGRSGVLSHPIGTRLLTPLASRCTAGNSGVQSFPRLSGHRGARKPREVAAVFSYAAESRAFSIGPSVAAEKAAMMRCWGPCVRPSTTQPAALGFTLWSKLLHLCYGLRACKGHESRMARTHALLADTPRESSSR